MTSPGSITAQELAERLARGDALVVLDVREPVERAICVIPIPPTAADLHIPMSVVPARLEEIRLSRGRGPLIVYCHHGVRSANVAAWLRRQGLDEVWNLTGGIDDWSQSVDPAVARY